MSQRRKISCGRAKIKISPYQVASCMYFYHIKQEYSTEQLLAFYWQGLGLQGRLIELYQSRISEIINYKEVKELWQNFN